MSTQAPRGYTPTKRVGLSLAVIPIVIALIALILQFTDWKLTNLLGLGSDGCADRLEFKDVPAPSATRMASPQIKELIYEQSQTLPGRVVIHLRWEATDSRTTMGQIHISGRRGNGSPLDFQVPLQYEPPQTGQCGTWYRSYSAKEPKQYAWFETFDGMWANETYCFSVNASDPNGGGKKPDGHLWLPTPSYHTFPKCIEAKWKSGWGKAAKPEKENSPG